MLLETSFRNTQSSPHSRDPSPKGRRAPAEPWAPGQPGAGGRVLV